MTLSVAVLIGFGGRFRRSGGMRRRGSLRGGTFVSRRSATFEGYHESLLRFFDSEVNRPLDGIVTPKEEAN